jgi:hypothetical protein
MGAGRQQPTSMLVPWNGSFWRVSACHQAPSVAVIAQSNPGGKPQAKLKANHMAEFRISWAKMFYDSTV